MVLNIYRVTVKYMRIVQAFSLSLLVMLAVCTTASGESLSIYFADIGMGGATLFHQPGKCSMLVDAGPKERGQEVVRLIREAGVNALDFVVVTHPHADRFGGLQSVAPAIKIREISDNGDMNGDEEGFENYSTLQSDLPYSVLAGGDSWRCGDVVIDVLHPSPDYDSGDDYDSRSLVLSVRYNTFRMLLLGSVSTSGEQELLKSGRNLHSMVLQLGHHWSANETTSELVTRIKPKIAIISGNRDTEVKATHQEAADSPVEQGITAFWTSRERPVLLRVAENGNIRLKP
jgi:competence protein ComEC